MGRKSLAKERRSQIIEAYHRCLVKQGIEGCTLANIAEEAGVPKGILTHYFKNKDEMAVELTNRTVEKYETAYLGQLEIIEDPGERLEKVLSIMFGDASADRDFMKAFLAVIYRASRNNQIREALAGMHERFYAYLKDLLLETCGENLDPEKAEQTAISIIALMDGIQGHWLLNPDRVHPGIALEMARALLDKVLGPNPGNRDEPTIPPGV